MSGASSDWPFADPKNVAVLTLWNILRGEVPILLVTHDKDGCWQFLDGDDIDDRDAAIVALSEVVGWDSTVRELADLPFGWRAWRDFPGGPWKREKKPPELREGELPQD